jgi:uncharacterized C2H2 Zn-finger protein
MTVWRIMERSCTSMPLFHCPTCGVEFTTQDELADHQRQAHQSAQGMQCRECGAQFATRTQLEEHAQLEHSQG